MVDLPGSLERSTLGDLLGALHRERVSGALCLTEWQRGALRRYVIHFRDGLIHEVDSPYGVLARARREDAGSPETAQARHERLMRLESLFVVERANVSFRVLGPGSPRSPSPLGPHDFLHGRKRLRDVTAPRSKPAERRAPDTHAGTSEPAQRRQSSRAYALATLGLSGDADTASVNAAFKKLARRWHPDLHPGAGEMTRAALCRRFAQIVAAYETLRAGAA